MTTIDHEVMKNKWLRPYLLKLDTHGFEAPIPEGAKYILKDTNLLVIELYNYGIGEKSIKF